MLLLGFKGLQQQQPFYFAKLIARTSLIREYLVDKGQRPKITSEERDHLT